MNKQETVKITQEEIKEKLILHAKYLLKQEGGERLNLRHADLSYAKLTDADLRHADLSHADLSYANLRYADLRHAKLNHADLSNADLTNADLSHADLSGANLPKTVKIENLFIQIQSAIKSGGRLNMSEWHGCETTHCIAGWVINLAGETGRVMENLLGTPWAAALLILESCPYLEGKVPNFHSSNEDGMKFINECVDKEKEITP